jgi:hypothetical protein
MNRYDDEEDASADGIRHCLRLLAEEAAALRLSGTFSAIEAALAMIALECDGGPQPPPLRYAGMLLH